MRGAGVLQGRLLGAAPGPRCAGFGLITTVFPRRQRPTFPATLSRHFQRVMRCCSRTSGPSFQAGTRFAWGDLGASRLPRFGVNTDAKTRRNGIPIFVLWRGLANGDTVPAPGSPPCHQSDSCDYFTMNCISFSMCRRHLSPPWPAGPRGGGVHVCRHP